ncbi:sarcinarray family MAST domain-containing protein [Methanosarcina sp. DH2]|uniref:sarcinarray family MAST domain-containing protein n=1 Tax=Methanosarcina sp. DH2 TaxID=2605639 RepID=UPI0021042221|nr:sarcinarray family MAST domain-containing protein [Methanosarcina sp. DH2]
MNIYTGDVVEEKSTKSYEWIVAPTENWAGGVLSIDLVYQINDFETGNILVNSGFTIAYPYISTEYYEGQSPASTSPETTTFPELTPAFTAIGTLLSLVMILTVFRR